jgi:asparagine synthase (glutamine-hydrolysing)
MFGFRDSFPVGEEIASAMADAIAHRGPDDHGTWVSREDRVAFGHRRLSIVDLTPAGHQPMANEDGSVWISYNGEVYNHAALRTELEAKGHRYRSNTDTETILHLYEEEGPACVERLEGMFGLAIWDGRRKELFLARDRLGVKPLLYAHLGNGLVFGSEAKAILRHPAVTADLDEEGFFHYLTFAFAPPPRTLFANVRKLGPAERMVVRPDGSYDIDTYWSPFSSSVFAEVAAMSDQEMIDRTRDLLRESIGKRMMSDVPFGVFLSGGLDSSTNVALMAELTSQPVRTYSTAPAGHERYDELPYARSVASKFGTDHHEIVIDESDLEAYIPELTYFQDEPTSDWTAIPQHFVTKLARDDGTIVVQVGEGSDEIFHGYKGYVDHRRYVLPFQRYVPPLVRRGVAGAAVGLSRRTGRGVRHSEALYDAARSEMPYWGGALCFRGDLKRDLVDGQLPYGDSLSIPEGHWRDAEQARPDADVFQKMTYVELKQRLPELLLMRLDKITMASSVEGRDPFLDHHLVEFALALPPRAKYRDKTGKWVLQQSMVGILPDEVLYRPKQGFGTPMVEWLRGDFGRRAQDAVRTSALRERGLLDPERVDGLFAAHRAGRGDWSYHLWNLYCASVWYDRWIAGRGG